MKSMICDHHSILWCRLILVCQWFLQCFIHFYSALQRTQVFFSVHVAVRGGKLQGACCQNPANDANVCITCRNGYVTVWWLAKLKIVGWINSTSKRITALTPSDYGVLASSDGVIKRLGYVQMVLSDEINTISGNCLPQFCSFNSDSYSRIGYVGGKYGKSWNQKNVCICIHLHI